MKAEQHKAAGGFQSLRWRILFWMLPVALGPLIIMAVQGYHCARQAVIASQEDHLCSVLISRQTRLQSWIEQVASDFRFMEVSPCLRGLCHGGESTHCATSCAEACNLLNDLKAGSPFYEFLGIYDAEWRRQVSSTGSDCHVHPDERVVAHGRLLPARALREQLAGSDGLVLIPPHICSGGRLIMHAGRRLTPAGAPGLAYIVADLEVSARIDPVLADRTGLGETGRAYLIIAEQLYFAPPDSAAVRLGGGLLASRFASGEMRVVRYRSIAGAPVLGVATQIPQLASLLVVEIDEQEAFRWLGILRTRALLTGLLTLALVLLFAHGGARNLAAPLRELAAVARRIADGQVEERVGRLPGSEAQALAEAFNQMIDQLDATHRRLLQTAALAAVGELSSSVVHEMRNPLSSIKMNLQALSAKVAGDAMHTELAEIASEQVARVERMLAELLHYGKPLQLRPTALRFADVAREVIDLTRRDAQAKDLVIEVSDETHGMHLWADAEQLKRALTNLLENALQASPAGGRVELAARIRDGVEISVADRGPGLPPEGVAQLFQPFFTTRDEGTGLGLANVKKIVECHGGAVFALNRPDGGARFGLRLPRGGLIP